MEKILIQGDRNKLIKLRNMVEKIKVILLLIPKILYFALPFNIEITYIENIHNPEQVIWRNSNEVIFVTRGKVYQYIVSENKNTFIREIEPNEFVGMDSDGELISCLFEHFTINSEDEFSTRFTVLEKDLYFFETIRPIHINEEEIIAVTAMDFLEEHFYRIDISNGKMKEIEEPKRRIWSLDISKDIYFKKGYVFNNQRYVIEDIYGNLYMYIKSSIYKDYLNRYILKILDLV